MVAAPALLAESVPGVPVAPVSPLDEVIALPGRMAGSTERAWAQTLPWASDDLTRDFPTVYESMALDPQISATTMVLIKSALNVTPRMQPFGAVKGQPDYALAFKIAQFCQANLDRLKVPINGTLYELGRGALHHGHKAAELVFRHDVWDPQVGQQLVLDRIKGKPLYSYLQVQDAYGNHKGVIPAWTSSPVFSQAAILQADGTINGRKLIEPAKVPILAHDPQNGDLRGQAAIRPAYNAWYMTQQMLPELLSLIARFGQPSIIGTNAPGQQDTPKTDSTGKALEAENPNKTFANALKQLRNGGVLALSAGQLAQILEAQTEGQIFFSALTLFTGWIVRSILGQTLATNEGNHRSGTDSATHQDILDVVVRFCKAWLADWTRQSLCVPLVEVNYGAAALRYVPLCSLGQTDPHNQPAIMASIAQLTGSKFYGPNGPTPEQRKQVQGWMSIPVDDDAGPDGIPGTPDDPKPLPTVAPAPAKEPMPNG